MTLTPNLSPEILDELRPMAFDFPPDRPRRGESAANLVESEGWSWLEGLVLAGYMPHFEGIILAVEGTHRFVVAEIETYEARGVLGDAIGWTSHVEYYRDLAARLLRHAAALERKRGQMLTETPMADSNPEWSARLVAAAEARAARAVERADATASDHEEFTAERV